MGFPSSSGGKESACNVGDLGSIPGLGRSPGGRQGNPLQDSCLENPHGQRSLVGYSPRGHKESDTTKRLTQHSTEPINYVVIFSGGQQRDSAIHTHVRKEFLQEE